MTGIQSTRVVLLALVFVARTAVADTIADVQAVLAHLPGKEPMRAMYTIDSSNTMSGRFANVTSANKISVEVSRSAAGVAITIPMALVEKADDETREHSGSIHNETVNGINHVSPLAVAEAMSYADSLLGILRMAKPVEEHRVLRDGHSVRRVTLDIHQPPQSGASEGGEMKTLEDRLILWVGDDGTPLAAQRSRKLRGGFLMFHGESTESFDWTFTRTADSLALVRFEEMHSFSGMGQDGKSHSLQTLVMH